MKKLLLCAWLWLPMSGIGADVNGYTAIYECKVDGVQCSVDVVSLAALPCDQTITTATTPAGDWSAINYSNRVICIEAGDHTGRGTLEFTANGTASTYKVLRYTRAGDSDDEPWNQASTAKIRRLHAYGDYWLIHRLDVDPSANEGVRIGNNAQNVILNRMWVHDAGNAQLIGIGQSAFSGVTDITVQNSLIHDTGIPGGGVDRHCILIGGGTDVNIRFVNNEIYNCAGDGIQKGSSDASPGLVVENNDIYLTTAYYSDGSGNLDPNGNRACAENGMDFKDGGSSASPIRVLHNRLWGFRQTDSNCAGTGSGGESIIWNEASAKDNRWGLVQNNIAMDGTAAINAANGSPRNWSVVGNIFYDYKGRDTAGNQVLMLSSSSEVEVYLNTFIDVLKDNSTHWANYGGGANKDIRCNVIISGGGTTGSPSGLEVSHNAFYGSTASGTNAVDSNLNTRANNTNYNLGDIIRTTATPPEDGTAGDFLYKVTQAGTSHTSSVSYCTTANCTTTDGSMIVQAIRGPYSFYRKLRTGQELIYIPYARIYSGAPEITLCPSGYNSRTGIGIGDGP